MCVTVRAGELAVAPTSSGRCRPRNPQARAPRRRMRRCAVSSGLGDRPASAPYRPITSTTERLGVALGGDGYRPRRVRRPAPARALPSRLWRTRAGACEAQRTGGQHPGGARRPPSPRAGSLTGVAARLSPTWSADAKIVPTDPMQWIRSSWRTRKRRLAGVRSAGTGRDGDGDRCDSRGPPAGGLATGAPRGSAESSARVSIQRHRGAPAYDPRGREQARRPPRGVRAQ